MTTYFQTENEDAPFIAQINAQFPEPANQPYLFYFLAGKKFFQDIMGKPAETLVSQSKLVVQAYKVAFQSRYELEALMDIAQATVALLAGDLHVVLTISTHSLALEINDRCLSVSQGPYAFKLHFNDEHKVISMSF